MTAFLWSISAAAALIYWALSLREGVSLSRSVIKGLAVTPLVLVALLAGAPIIGLALALCALGDVCLSRPGQGPFLAGLSAFALGHLGWIAVFVLRFAPTFSFDFDVLRWGLCLIMLALGLFMARALLPRAGALRVPVGGYICIIIVMGVVALATGSAMVIGGAALFMASDTLLGMQTFVLTQGTTAERRANALIWPLYWAAIVVLTLGCL